MWFHGEALNYTLLKFHHSLPAVLSLPVVFCITVCKKINNPTANGIVSLTHNQSQLQIGINMVFWSGEWFRGILANWNWLLQKGSYFSSWEFNKGSQLSCMCSLFPVTTLPWFWRLNPSKCLGGWCLSAIETKLCRAVIFMLGEKNISCMHIGLCPYYDLPSVFTAWSPLWQ